MMEMTQTTSILNLFVQKEKKFGCSWSFLEKAHPNGSVSFVVLIFVLYVTVVYKHRFWLCFEDSDYFHKILSVTILGFRNDKIRVFSYHKREENLVNVDVNLETTLFIIYSKMAVKFSKCRRNTKFAFVFLFE